MQFNANAYQPPAPAPPPAAIVCPSCQSACFPKECGPTSKHHGKKFVACPNNCKGWKGWWPTGATPAAPAPAGDNKRKRDEADEDAFAEKVAEKVARKVLAALRHDPDEPSDLDQQ